MLVTATTHRASKRRAVKLLQTWVVRGRIDIASWGVNCADDAPCRRLRAHRLMLRRVASGASLRVKLIKLKTIAVFILFGHDRQAFCRISWVRRDCCAMIQVSQGATCTT